MTRNLSIFDIPHVMERIGSYLDRKDQLSCTLVNKAFHNEFSRLLWSNITFRHHQLYSKQSFDPDRIQAISRNIQWTRKLSIDIQCPPEVISILSESCFNLRDFTIFISRKQRDDSNERLMMSAINMVARNTRLRSCSFIRYAILSNSSLEKLTGAFSRSPCLTELVLEFRIVPPPRGWLQCVLQNLPRTLKKLSLLWVKPNETNGVESFQTCNWPETYQYLEVADLIVELAGHDEQMFLQFLERCPALVSCSFPKLATMEACTSLTRMLRSKCFPFTLKRLNWRMLDAIDASQWRDLLLAMSGHIQSFIIGVDFIAAPARHFIYDMTRHWSSTLESLNIYHADLISSSDIQLILTTCSRLKSLNCLCYWLLWTPNRSQDGSNVFPGLNVMVRSDSDADNSMVDWVCLELEELKLTFSDGRSASAEEPLLSQQERQVTQGIRRVYEQLGRLERLKELTIAWCSSDRFLESANLDMSLQSGMGRMENLKLLSMVDVNDIPKVNIGMEEAQWILDKWPMLKTIRGLKYHRELVDDEGEPDHIVFLKSRRQWLEIC